MSSAREEIKPSETNSTNDANEAPKGRVAPYKESETPDDDIDGFFSEELDGLFEGSELAPLATSPELQGIIQGAMDGTLPLHKPLEVNQPRKLSKRAIQAVLLNVGNYYTITELAKITGVNYVYLTKLLKHPYAERIFAIASSHAIAQFSQIDRRLKRKSPKMLKVVEQLAMNENVDPPVRLRAAFGWLDRAGHGEKKRAETNVNHNHNVSGEVLVKKDRQDLLLEAIKEANGVAAPTIEAEIIEDEDVEGSYENPEVEIDDEELRDAS